MSSFDEIGIRMKEEYEKSSKFYLERKKPVIIRVDGRAFHTYTRNFEKPYDIIMMQAMQKTMQYLCKNIQGTILGYQQSDEISILVTDTQSDKAEPWFEYNVQKVASISAALATLEFNKVINDTILNDPAVETKPMEIQHGYEEAYRNGAVFDSRCFNIPEEEVCNYFYWRQLDARRNSIQMTGHSYFSNREMHGKSNEDILSMLLTERNIDWNKMINDFKVGCCCVKHQFEKPNPMNESQTVIRHEWILDHNVPMFVGSDRNYVEERLFLNKE